jgi:hypothetical protein
VTGGEGLAVVTGHGVADFVWYQLPTKWLCDLDEKLFIAAALGEFLPAWTCPATPPCARTSPLLRSSPGTSSVGGQPV